MHSPAFFSALGGCPGIRSRSLPRAIWQHRRQPAPRAPEQSCSPPPVDPGASGRSNSASRRPGEPRLAPLHLARMPPLQSTASARCSTDDAAQDRPIPRHLPSHRSLAPVQTPVFAPQRTRQIKRTDERRPSPEAYADTAIVIRVITAASDWTNGIARPAAINSGLSAARRLVACRRARGKRRYSRAAQTTWFGVAHATNLHHSRAHPPGSVGRSAHRPRYDRPGRGGVRPGDQRTTAARRDACQTALSDAEQAGQRVALSRLRGTARKVDMVVCGTER